VAADGVLAGAETIRGTELILSVWHPELVSLRESLGLPRHPVQMVATRRGVDMDGALVFNVPEVAVIVLTTAAGAVSMQNGFARRPWVTPVLMEGTDDLTGAFEQLRSAGMTRVSCIGGRGIAAQLLDAGLVDDIYLTTAASIGGEPGTPISSRPLPGRIAVRKHGTGTESAVVFEHLSRVR
jgi:riboflavin biosynthesis pyrimidine reductase